MKKLLILFVALATLLVPSVIAQGIGSPDVECTGLGFDFGVAKWECGAGGWSLSEGDANTIVTGSCDVADWDVDSTNATGIVVKAGNIEHGGVHYAIWGTSGTVDEEKDLSHITFCGDEEYIPEFGLLTGLAAFGAAGAGYLFIRKKR